MSLKNRAIIVTGGAGLIGSFLTERLVGAGAKVIVIDDFSRGRHEYLSSVLDRIEIRKGNLEDFNFAGDALADAEVVFHLASRSYGVGYSSKHHMEILEHNERVTNNVLGALYRHRPQYLLTVSSSCVYPDDGPETISELSLFDGEPERVNWGYGWAKRFLEQKARIFSREAGVPVAVVRPFNIYGERYTWAGEASQAIPMLVKKVMDGENPVVVWGSGTQRRNYLHASDCADAMAGLAAAGFAGVVNIGTEETISLRELVDLICRVAGRQPRIVTDPTKPEGRRIKSANSTRLRQAYPGFHCRVDLAHGIARMVKWYESTFCNRATRTPNL